MRNREIRAFFVIGVAIAAALAPGAARAQAPAGPPAQGQTPPAGQPAAQGKPAAPGGFTGSATAGVSIESGRTDLTGTQLSFDGRRPYSAGGALALAAKFTHATTLPPGRPERITIANRLEGRATIEHNYGKRLIFMVGAQALRDPIARIDYRIEQVDGVGVRLGNPRVQVRVVPGVAFLTTDKNIESENGFHFNYGVYQDAMLKLAPTWTVTQYLNTSRDVHDSNDYYLALAAKLTGAVTRRLGVQLSYDYSYESLLPAGIEPEYSKLVAGLQIVLGKLPPAGPGGK